MKICKLLLFLLITPSLIFAQSNWTNNALDERAFVKNKGQYDNRNWQRNNEIKYALSQQDGWFTFFTEKGITHRFDKLMRNPNKKKGEKGKPSRVHKSELIDIFFVNANNNINILAEEQTGHHYSYAVKDMETNEVSNIKNVYGNKKITYKNIYNNIDIEYTLHPDGGIKYNIILNPGANPSDVKLKYVTKHTNISDENINIALDNNGELKINTSTTEIIEHKPVTFYANSNTPINSSYSFNNNILTFNLDNYDNMQKVIIDPWVVTPIWDDGDFTREVETDAAGNVYAIGGETPMELRKYSAAGVLQWTYVTPWDTNGGSWLGTLATDAAGVSYITQGVNGAEIERVSTVGAMVWHANAGGFLNITEYWTITFNCDNTRLIVGGTGGAVFNYEAKIYDIDLTNGSVISDVTVGTQGGFTPIEVRSIAPTKNSKYVYLTHTEVGAINQNLTACSSIPDFEVDNTFNLGYKCENYLSASQNGGGLKAIIANDDYFYTHGGDQILQWNINTGALLNTVNLPGGSANTTFGIKTVHCSGLDVDAAGNVYAGSMDRVVKFDANLNVLSSTNTTLGFTVYDVSVNSNGEVIAGGALLDNGTSTGRGGRIESLSMTAGSQYATICCDPNFCPLDQACETDAPITLNPNNGGGTWSSSPATAGLNTTTGVFDPSVAGVGSYTITYTLGCGSYSSTIDVGNCSVMTICVEANGDLTVSGGTGPYTWDEGSMQPTCVPGLGNCAGLFSFTDPGPSVLTWSNFVTGTTVTPPIGADTIKVTGSFGDSLVVFDISLLPACGATVCDATINIAGPFCPNDSPVNLTAADPGGTWTGTGITNGTNGTFDPATAGTGNHLITYTLPTCNDTIIIVVNADDNAAFSYASASYCLTDSDPTPTITGTAGGAFTIDNSGTINSSTGEIDITTSGVGAYVVTYITNGSCPDTATFNVSIVSSADATITHAGPFCANEPSFDLTAVGAGGTWTGTGITNGTNGTFDAATAGAGNHLITYTISGSCGDVDTMTITIDPADNAAFSYASGSYCLTDADPTPTITGTAGGAFTIDNSGTINGSTGEIDITTSGVGAYVVTYITSGACPDTATFNVSIITVADATIDPAGPFCANAVSVNLTAAGVGGTWTGNGITNGTNGTFDPATAGIGGHLITYTISGSCGDVDTMTITVNATDDASFTYATATFCDTDIDPIPTSITTTGGTFSIDNGGTINSTTGEVDLSASGIGSYVITYTTNGVCPNSSTLNVTITTCATPTAIYTVSDSIICDGDCVTFTDMSTATTGWEWTFNGGTPSFASTQGPHTVCFNGPGIYNIQLIASNATDADTTTSTVEVFANPVVNAGSNVTIDLGESTVLDAIGSNGSYNWTPPTWLSCPTCPTTTSTPDETVTYTVTVVDSNGCSASDNVTVIVDFEFVIWVPNIFSPNGDNNNDKVFVRGVGVESLNFVIYDRWGEKVFETSDMTIGWDGTFRGKKMNNAVFVYYLEATFLNGETTTKKGDITLVR